MIRIAQILLLAAAIPSLAAAADNDNVPIHYVVQRGDTLIGLGERYLVRPEHYRIVQRQNGITNPYTMPVGKVLNIPRALLKFKPAKARLVSVRGRVITAQAQASVGQFVNEGAALSTAESSFATLLLDDGSRISLPSNSDIRIRRLRSYVLGGSLDYDFDVIKGGLQSGVTKQKSSDDRYQVRTPKAVSAVRGTDFQSRYDIAANRDFAEVIEGSLAVETAAATEAKLSAGNGLALADDGKVIREALLMPPTLLDPGRLQADPEVSFIVEPETPASGYRISLAADAGFIDQIADTVIAENKVVFRNVGNGNYFVRARAISSNGIEGMPVTYVFKRRLNGITASASQGDDGYAFKWVGDGDGIKRHHFQLFLGSVDTLPFVDEASLDDDRVLISDLPPGIYFWRVGAVQYFDGEVSTNWTPFEKLTLAAP